MIYSHVVNFLVSFTGAVIKFAVLFFYKEVEASSDRFEVILHSYHCS